MLTKDLTEEEYETLRHDVAMELIDYHRRYNRVALKYMDIHLSNASIRMVAAFSKYLDKLGFKIVRKE